MVIDLALTAVALGRWSSRHYGNQATNRAQTVIDKYTPDEWMELRFIEWSFLDNK